MIPWQLLESAPVPGSSQALCLYRRGNEFAIRVGNRELMNSRMHGSEDALADLACAKLTDRSPRVLIGGLGMGFTLAAALRRLGPKSEVVVAELVPAVVAWNRGPLGALAGHPLADLRVTVREVDVMQILEHERHAYDAILLDVDNGPEDLLLRGNDRLYAPPALAAAASALRPKGVLGIWSAAADHAFVRRLRHAGFAVEEITARARGARGGGHHAIWVAQLRTGNEHLGPTR
jgi:spermidine synthase